MKNVECQPKYFVSFLGYWPLENQLFPEPKSFIVIALKSDQLNPIWLWDTVLSVGKKMGKKWLPWNDFLKLKANNNKKILQANIGNKMNTFLIFF